MFPQVFGKFVLESELSSGGMARVFVATLRGAVGFEKRLVVKQIRPELASDARFVERFVEEAKTSVELSHPNIVTVYELGVEAGVYYIAMELCPGVTLADLLLAEGALEAEEGAYVGVELARALGYAHRRAGIVHRDVTPRNVLIDDEGAVRLIDFGIAAPVAADQSAEREVFGTPGHMPPEQIRGDRLTPATDVFALAALLVETWSGRAPFRRATQEESLRAVWEAAPPLDVPRLRTLESLISACLLPEPKERPQEMDELGRALRDFLREADTGDLARAVGKRVRRVRRASRSDEHETARRGSGAPAERQGVTAAAHGAPSGRSSRTTPFAAEGPPLSTRGEVQVSRTFATRPLPVQLAPQGVALEASAFRSEPETRRFGSDPAIASPELQSAAAGGPGESDHAAQLASSGSGPGRRRVAVALGAVLAAAALAALPRGGALEPSASEVKAAGATPSAAFPQVAADQGAASRVPGDPKSPTIEPSAPALAAAEPASAQERAQRAAPSASRRKETSFAAPLRIAPPHGSAARSTGTAPLEPSHAAEKTSVKKVGAVALTSAPSAQVSIAGRTLSTPVKRLELPAGSYRATFRSPTWDGVVSAEVELVEGSARSVHADFTSQPPRVVVR